MRNQESIDFVRENREGDVRQLALKGAQGKNVDIAWALDQISGWQSACTKLPEWAAADGIIYPPHLSMEQCSSEQTAKYKVKVVDGLRSPSNSPEGERSLIDLTGGFGVDFSYMARGFQKVIYVERSPPKGGGLLIYLDPARRDIHGKKTYAISDCTPDVVALKDLLLEKANNVMVKLSPMLDWHKAVEELGEVQEVHIVSVDNECKELLLVLRGVSGKDQETRRTRVCSVNLQSHGGIEEFDFDNTSLSSNHSSPIGEVRRGLYLYEPNASLMKAGCFDELAERFGVNPIASNSHLFVSESLKKDFPGRIFQITAVSSMNKKALRENLLGINKANIAVRNFPLSVAELRKRLKLADGGDIYLFATTTAEKEHLLLFSKKV